MNITLSLDDQLIAAAKALAARQGTSVTALVRASLEQSVAVDAASLSSGATGVLHALARYSMGLSPRTQVMQEVGAQDYRSLLQMLSHAGLSRPIVPLAKRSEMAKAMVDVLED